MADDDTTPSADEKPATDATDQQQDKGQASAGTIPPEVERALRKANKEAETLRLKLKEFEDRDKTEAEKLVARAEAAESELSKTKAEALRARVALAKGLPPALADRLRGDDEDQLLADADELLALTNTRRKPAGDVDQGARQDDRPKQLTREQLKGMTPAQIVEAKKAGRLDDALAGKH